MNFKYTDLPKEKNFIGFESGIICLYPNQNGSTYIQAKNPVEPFHYGCVDNEFYATNYGVTPPPSYYDPRCRGWYSDQYNQTYSTFSDVYTYANGDLGITNCVPLWANNNKNSVTQLEYRGAYCLDLYPTSQDQFFVQKYYNPGEGAHVDYIIFTEDEDFQNYDFGTSDEPKNVRKYMQELVFSNSTVGKNFTITDIFMEERMVNELSQYIQQFDDKYDLEKVAMLPDEPIRIGTVTVQDQDSLEFEEYMFICDSFQVELTQIANYKNESSGQVKEYTFMLIIPKNLISEKIDTVN